MELTPTHRESRGGSLVWAVPNLSDAIMRRARRWAWVLRGPVDLPPSDGILMGFQAGPPAKRLRIPKASGRAKAQGRGPVRVVAGSLGSSPPEGVIRGIPCAFDPCWDRRGGSCRCLPRRIKVCDRRVGVTRCMLALSHYRSLLVF